MTSADVIGTVVSVQTPAVQQQQQQPQPPPPPPNSTRPQPPSSLLRDDSSIASGSSGFGSLTKKRGTPDKTPEFHSNEMDPATYISSLAVTDSSESSGDTAAAASSHNSSSSDPLSALLLPSGVPSANIPLVVGPSSGATGNNSHSPVTDLGHSRNSSNTSQVSSILGWLIYYFRTIPNYQLPNFPCCRCPRDRVTVVFRTANIHAKVPRAIRRATNGKSPPQIIDFLLQSYIIIQSIHIPLK